ncbi:MAG: hypothetical protein NVS3B20_18250 [Polyangiales bacterium]
MDRQLKLNHIFRFTRSLTLTSTLVLPACGSASDDVTKTTAEVGNAIDGATGDVVVDDQFLLNDGVDARAPDDGVAALSDGTAHDADADTPRPAAGPLPPPELPFHFA